MTAPAPAHPAAQVRCVGSSLSAVGKASGLCLAVALCCIAHPASAEVGGTASIFSDARFRGQSVSNGDPVATVDVTYDDLSGFYLAGSGDVVLTSSSPELLRVTANVGFARQLHSGLTVDGGLVRSEYSEQYSGGSRAHYTEIYAGVIVGPLSAHLHYSPDYFRPGTETAYADVAASISPAPGWRLDGHLGALVRLSGGYASDSRRTRYDWKLGIARRAGPFDLQIAWSGRESGGRAYEPGSHGGSAVTFGAVYAF